MNQNVISQNEVLLGEITANGQPKSNMMAYTINLPPNYYHSYGIMGYDKWSDMLPVDQERFLKGVHTRVFRILRKYLEDDNMVVFEFTKKGEVHSHGYYRYKQTYVGYEIHKVTLTKIILKELKLKNKWATLVKWVTEEDKWISYLRKDLATSGFKEYKTSGEQIINKQPSILRYLNSEVKPIDREISDTGEISLTGADITKEL